MRRGRKRDAARRTDLLGADVDGSARELACCVEREDGSLCDVEARDVKLLEEELGERLPRRLKRAATARQRTARASGASRPRDARALGVRRGSATSTDPSLPISHPSCGGAKQRLSAA